MDQIAAPIGSLKDASVPHGVSSPMAMSYAKQLGEGLTTVVNGLRSAIDFVIFVNRFDIDGSRKITEIAEVQGMQGDVVTIAPIVRFEHDPNDPEHSGWFVPTGERFMRRHIEKMANEGVFVDDDWFNPQAVF